MALSMGTTWSSQQESLLGRGNCFGNEPDLEKFSLGINVFWNLNFQLSGYYYKRAFPEKADRKKKPLESQFLYFSGLPDRKLFVEFGKMFGVDGMTCSLFLFWESSSVISKGNFKASNSWRNYLMQCKEYCCSSPEATISVAVTVFLSVLLWEQIIVI